MHITKWKKPIWKGCIQYDSYYMTFWERQNWRQIGRAQRIFRAVELLCMIVQWCIHIIIYVSKPTECTIARVNPSVSYGLWVILMWQCSFISCNKCTTLVGHVDNEGGGIYFGAGGIWEISVPSTQFCCEPQTALKNCLLKTTIYIVMKMKYLGTNLIKYVQDLYAKDLESDIEEEQSEKTDTTWL